MNTTLAEPSFEPWQCFAPLYTHLVAYCIVHTVYDACMWLGWEIVSGLNSSMRMDEIAFFTWNVVSLVLNLAGGAITMYVLATDFDPTFHGIHTWPTMFFALFVVDMMFLVRQRLYFKQKILRFLIVHHLLTFGVCILYLTAFTYPQFLGPAERLATLPMLWNASSAISNGLFLYRMVRGVGKVDAALLRVNTACFYAQRAWRISVYALGFYLQTGHLTSKLLLLLPGAIMDVFDSMSQSSAIALIKQKMQEDMQHAASTRALLERMQLQQPALQYDSSRSPSPSPSPTIARRRLSSGKLQLYSTDSQVANTQSTLTAQ